MTHVTTRDDGHARGGAGRRQRWLPPVHCACRSLRILQTENDSGNLPPAPARKRKRDQRAVIESSVVNHPGCEIADFGLGDDGVGQRRVVGEAHLRARSLKLSHGAIKTFPGQTPNARGWRGAVRRNQNTSVSGRETITQCCRLAHGLATRLRRAASAADFRHEMGACGMRTAAACPATAPLTPRHGRLDLRCLLS